MWTDRVRLLDDTSVADWLPARVSGAPGTVSGVVPAGYPAYARVLHPVDAETDRSPAARWSEVAQVTGRRTHPLVQWHRLIGSADPWNPESPLWPEGRPNQGSLSTAPLLALCTVLAEHTRTPEDCTFALWEGFGHLHGGMRMLLTAQHPSRAPRWIPRLGRRRARWTSGVPVPGALDDADLRAPRLELPGRDYLLFAGPLDAIEDLVRYESDPFPGEQSPNLFWPADRSWCVGTEIDFDSTIVAGDADLIDAVLASPELEAWPVQPGDSLRFDGDTLNA